MGISTSQKKGISDTELTPQSPQELDTFLNILEDLLSRQFEDSLKDICDNVKCPNIQIIGILREDKRKEHEEIFEEIIVETISKMGMELATPVQEAQRVPYRINPTRNTPRHILIRLTKIKHKEQILKASREKQQIT